jgi:pimeloyl-ACP methyl ester carboxylesterase
MYQPGNEFLNLRSPQRCPLHHVELGSGTPILLLHGFGANLVTWRHLVRPLGAMRRVIAVDLVGCGTSPKPRSFDYSLGGLAAAVLDFIEVKELNDLVLVGHSAGGGIALMIALWLQQAARPLRGLVVIDGISYPQSLPLFIKLLRTPILGPLVVQLPAYLQVCYALRIAYYNQKMITRETISSYADPLREAAARGALLATARGLIPDNVDKLVESFSTIAVPTLLLWGRQDAIVPLSNGLRLHRAIAGSLMTIFDDCGHVPPEEMPVQTLEVLTNFITKVS